jgi:predicted AlkP superfamily pyrophosphatase or phosphodiesterase
VLLVVIDAATPRVVWPAIRTGRLPTMQRLIERGSYHDTCTTIFPSITPAATTSIITGEYPATSGIVGASWYEEDTRNVAYFGDDFWVIAREGFRSFLDDFLVGLNGDRLVAPTLFEMVERAGAWGTTLMRSRG